MKWVYILKKMHHRLPIKSLELLVETNKRAAFLNVLTAFMLALYLWYYNVPLQICELWLLNVILVNVIRWYFCDHIRITTKSTGLILKKFTVLMLMMGLAWGWCYLISLNYLSQYEGIIVILVFAGMCSGSIASLSSHLPAYFSYILPMILPFILYNYYSLNRDQAIIATILLLYLIMVSSCAKINKKLFQDNMDLSYEKDLLIQELQIISITDPLTGLYNRRHFQAMFPQELNKARNEKCFFNLVYVDIDNFKMINDFLGHPSGDKFLVDVGKLFQNDCYQFGITLFRIGGDEFAATILNKSLNEALEVCEMINKHFKDTISTNSYSTEQVYNQITLSIGLVNINFDSIINIDKVVSIADKALYRAKKFGKNQIISITL